MEWINYYKHGKEVLSENAEVLSELTSIFHNPSYYSRWFNRTIFENLDYISSAPAEQNHSSICAIFLVCGNLSIVQHAIALINRYISKHVQRTEEAYDSKSRRKFYKSVFSGVRKEIAEKARKVLGNYMYKKFKIELYNNLTFNYEMCNGVWYYHVYQPSYTTENRMACPYYQKIPAGGRCKCSFAFNKNAQCCHEVCIHKSFEIKFFSRRWLNNETYDSLTQNTDVIWYESKRLGTSQNYCEVINVNNVQVDEKISSGALDLSPAAGHVNASSTYQENLDGCNSNNLEQQSVDNSIDKLSYNSLLDSCKDLLRLIKNEPIYMHLFQETIVNCTERARAGRNISTFFGTNSIPESNTNNDNLKSVFDSYLPGVLGNCPNATNKKRSLSAGEVHNNYRDANSSGHKRKLMSQSSEFPREL